MKTTLLKMFLPSFLKMFAPLSGFDTISNFQNRDTREIDLAFVELQVPLANLPRHLNASRCRTALLFTTGFLFTTNAEVVVRTRSSTHDVAVRLGGGHRCRERECFVQQPAMGDDTFCDAKTVLSR